MKMDLSKYNKDWLTKTTGDPFVDIGGSVIDELWKVDYLRDKDILELIKYLTDIYVNKWSAKINPYFLNSKITQPSFKGEKKIGETMKYYRGLLEETLPYEEGYCRVLGVKTKLFAAGRDNHIMSGSGKFINFHHSFQTGIMLSKEALIRMFFIPFGTQFLGNKIALIDSNNPVVARSYVEYTIRQNFHRLSSGLEAGVFKSEFNHPSTALFDFAKKYISEHKIGEGEETEINLYHFTNFGAAPDIELYRFSTLLFRFYRKIMHRRCKSDWEKFVRSHHRNSKVKNVVYDLDKETYTGKVGKQETTFDYEGYKSWFNPMYLKLIEGKNILPDIIRWNKTHSFTFKIVRIYQESMKNMDKKTLDKIEEIADFVVADKDGKLKRRVAQLNGAKKTHEVRQFLLALIKDNHSSKNPSPLISLKEYVEYLFPDGVGGAEIRDLLIICIYQKMHEQGKFFDSKIDE